MPSKKKKYNSRFPPARIKKIMQTDEEVGKVAAAVPVIISRALELFIESLILKANETTVAKNAKTLTTSHIKQTIEAEKKFDFLKELVSAIPDHQPEEDPGDNSAVSEVKRRGPRGPRKSKDGPGRKRKDRKSSSESSEANANDDDEETETDEEEEENRLDPPVMSPPVMSPPVMSPPVMSPPVTSPTIAAPSTSQLASPPPNQLSPTAHIPLSHIPEMPSIHTPQMPGIHTQMPGIHTQMPGIHEQMPGIHTPQMPGIHTQMPNMNTQMSNMHTQMPFNSLPYQMSPTMPAVGMPSVSSFSLPPKQIVEDDDYDA